METIPEMEEANLRNACESARRLALMGHAGAGLHELEYGLRRARAVTDPWGQQLTWRWEAALRNYRRQWMAESREVR